MKKSESRPDLTIFQQIARQTSEVWFLYDLQTQVIDYLGPTFELVWKKDRQAYLDHPAAILETIHPDDQDYLIHNYQELLREKEKVRLDFRIILPDQKQRWIALKVYPIEQDNKVRFVAGFAEDDTPRKENLLAMQTVVGKMNASMEVLSHDMRGSLGMIQALAGLIEGEVSAPQDLQLLEHLLLIRRICQRNIDLVRQLTDQEFLNLPDVELDMERLDLVAEVQAILGNYQQSQEDIAREFELTSSQKSIYAEVDSNKFLSIINNLLSNAIKFTNDRGHIHVHLEEQEDIILITVQDNGIGIPAKLQPALFDKFTKARRPGLKGEESVGLGMSIIKRLVEMHKGKIWFESEEHKGTTFYIQFNKNELSNAQL
jgi:two-component system sensor histidine kinase VicK